MSDASSDDRNETHHRTIASLDHIQISGEVRAIREQHLRGRSEERAKAEKVLDAILRAEGRQLFDLCPADLNDRLDAILYSTPRPPDPSERFTPPKSAAQFAVPAGPRKAIVHDCLFEGRLTVISGRIGVGKTLTIETLAARITRGQAILDLPAYGPERVLFLTSSEDGNASHEARLCVGGVNRDLLTLKDFATFYSDEEDRLITPIPSEGDSALHSAIKIGGYRVIIINPLRTFMSAFSHSDVRESLDDLSRLAESENVALVVVDYERPDQGPYAAFSTELRARARAILVVEPAPDGAPNERILRIEKQGDAADGAKARAPKFRIVDANGIAKLEWIDVVPVAPALTTSSSRRGPQPTTQRVVAAWLAESLATPRLSRDVLRDGRQRGYSQSTIYKVAKDLRVTSESTGERNVQRLWSLRETKKLQK